MAERSLREGRDVPAPVGFGDEDGDRARQDADQSAADLDQTQSDSDQSAADSDQKTSDTDQRQAERDQHASDRDQAAADAERADSRQNGTAASVHEGSRLEREAASRERGSAAKVRVGATAQRLETAEKRDEVSRVRDLTAAARERTADLRDTVADARDRGAEARERRDGDPDDPDEAVAALKALRIAGAKGRREAGIERDAAASDRRAAAEDREEAATDRIDAGLDELTGIFRRGTGELALAHEIDRSRRLGLPMVLAMIDVDGLKVVNDENGHAAGDTLLRDVVTAVTSMTRSYDVTVRWGGDEFLCAMSSATLDVASKRATGIRDALEGLRHGASVTTGLAELQPDDTLSSLVARADAALYRAKESRAA